MTREQERAAGPVRVQLRRTKGWRLQEVAPGAVKVDRTTRWGNRYRIGGPVFRVKGFGKVRDAAEAVELFRTLQAPHMADIAQLRGRDLACWCKLCARHSDGKPLGVECSDCAPCHADVELEMANRAVRAQGTPQ